MNDGLTGCTENARVFLGNKARITKTQNGKDIALFDVSFGIHLPESGKFGTWRHCIAYGDICQLVKELKPGAYLKISGWVVTNPVYNEHGKIEYVNGKPVTKEYVIITELIFIERDKPVNKQLSLVGENTR